MDNHQGDSTASNHEISNIDLTALRHGPEVLDPGGIPEIKKIEVLEFDITPKSEAHRLTTIQGSDILRSTSAHNIIPTRGILTRAAFVLHLANSPKPIPFELQPPDTIKTHSPAEAGLVRSWLEKSHFIAHTRLLVLIPLCLALATAPAFADGDFDQDDIDTDRSRLICLHPSPSLVFHPIRRRRITYRVSRITRPFGHLPFAIGHEFRIRVHPCPSVVFPRLRRKRIPLLPRNHASRITYPPSHHASLATPSPPSIQPPHLRRAPRCMPLVPDQADRNRITRQARDFMQPQLVHHPFPVVFHRVNRTLQNIRNRFVGQTLRNQAELRTRRPLHL